MGTDSVTITGHGDDAVTVKIPGINDDTYDLYEEIYVVGEPVTFRFSDGTVLSIEYTADGVWKSVVHRQGTATVEVVEAKDNSLDDLAWPDYTDQVAVGPVDWVEQVDGPDADDNDAPVQLWRIG